VNAKNLIEVASGGHRIREHQLDPFIWTDDEDGAHGGIVAGSAALDVSPASAGSML